MCKLKTHSWAKKRFKITKKWKIIHKKAWKNHLLMNKEKSYRNYKYWKILDKVEAKRVKALFPNN